MNRNEIKWRIKTLISNTLIGFKYITLPLARRNDIIVNHKTDIVVEGYPRSGNTFCVALLYYLEPKLKIARHRHELGHLKYAIKLKKPIVCVVRNPLDSIISLHIREKLSISFCIEYYIKFHKYLYENRNYIYIIDFNLLIKEPTEVIKNINKATSLQLAEVVITEHATEDIKKIVKDMELKESEFLGLDSTNIRSSHIAIPTKERNEYKQKIIKNLNLKKYENKINKANKLFNSLLEEKVKENANPTNS